MAVRRNVEPTPWATCRAEQEANEPEAVTCEECSEPLEDVPHVVTVLGKAFCTSCAVDEICRLRHEEWGALTEKDRLDLLEELGEAAERERSAIVRRLQSARKAG